MPRHSPFTTLCGRLSKLERGPFADLHVHTTASDGDFTPSQAIAFARQAGLSALAITDHDTLAGAIEARREEHQGLELIVGVEISTAFAGRELHLLGYFVRLDHAGLNARLVQVCDSRRERFRDYLQQLARAGVRIPIERVTYLEETSPSLGRRHVARLLTSAGVARNLTEAFHRFLSPLRGCVRPKLLVPIEEAIHLVREAGGVTSLAHPPPELSEDDFRTLAGHGLSAVEIDYPSSRTSSTARLRELASRYGLAVSGGSDSHGAQAGRRIGSHGIGADELERLRSRAPHT